MQTKVIRCYTALCIGLALGGCSRQESDSIDAVKYYARLVGKRLHYSQIIQAEIKEKHSQSGDVIRSSFFVYTPITIRTVRGFEKWDELDYVKTSKPNGQWILVNGTVLEPLTVYYITHAGRAINLGKVNKDDVSLEMSDKRKFSGRGAGALIVDTLLRNPDTRKEEILTNLERAFNDDRSARQAEKFQP